MGEERLAETSFCASSDDEEEAEELEINLLPSTSVIKKGDVSKTATFLELGLSKWLCDQLRHLAMSTPTPVQVNCIPHILAGSDVLGCAKTGTGKTLAFALPILHE
ncbi:unnamed protein product, partial [Onchocerca ochengi]